MTLHGKAKKLIALLQSEEITFSDLKKYAEEKEAFFIFKIICYLVTLFYEDKNDIARKKVYATVRRTIVLRAKEDIFTAYLSKTDKHFIPVSSLF